MYEIPYIDEKGKYQVGCASDRTLICKQTNKKWSLKSDYGISTSYIPCNNISRNNDAGYKSFFFV